MIKLITFTQLVNEPNFDVLIAEYGDEARLEGLPFPSPNIDMYLTLERNGTLFINAIYDDALLVGFMACNMATLPQYSAAKVCAEMSFFVAKTHRRGGTGKRLHDASLYEASVRGAEGFVITAKANSVFSRVVEHWGFTESNRIYFKAL
jgi:GNAT superfamily N-acetyltransferase